MKTTAKFFLAALAITAAASCAKEFEAAQTSEQIPEGFEMVTLNVQIDEMSKAATLGSDLSVKWAVGDSVALFDGIKETANTFKVASVSGKNAVIYGTVSQGASLYVAVYPYTAATSLASGKLTLNIPATQTIEAGKNIDGLALVSVARTMAGQTLAFKNVVSLVKFTVPEGVTAVTVKGNNSEKFIGSCTESLDTLAPASTKLTVKAAEGALAAGEYYAAVCPATFKNGITAAVATSDGAIVKVGANQAKFVKNGGLNLGSLSTGTKVPTAIATKEDLVNWAAYRSYLPAGTTTTFTADIDLTGVEWIVPTDNFCGNIDGKCHRVYNITATSEKTGDVGLLGRIGDGTTSYTVKDICAGSKDYNFDTKTGTYDGVSKYTMVTKAPLSATGTVVGTYYYPGMVTYLHHKSVLSNVVNFATVEITEECTCNRRVGGVAGTMKENSSMENCINFGTIIDNGSVASNSANAATLGGVVGGMDGVNGKLIGCKNNGKITIDNTLANSVGGICGISNKTGLTIKDCENKGEITILTVNGDKTDNYFGGITAWCNVGNLTITGCKNYGDITCAPESFGSKNAYIGGIIGQIGYSATSSKFQDCHNYGTITLEPKTAPNANCMMGGMVGYYGSNAGLMENCTNEGDIIKQGFGKSSYTGGLIGYLHRNAKKAVIKDCTNKGGVYHCSTDSVLGYLGGIIATTENVAAAADLVTITNCCNEGEVTVSSPIKNITYIGGVAGNIGTNVKLLKCSNSAKITPCTEDQAIATACRVGGVSGTVQGQLEECSNSGEIYCNAGKDILQVQLGGVISGTNTPQSITKCSNTGKITVENCSNAATASSYIGSITGLLAAGGVYTECVAGGEICIGVKDSISVYVGGFAGLINANTGTTDVTLAEGCSVDVKITVDGAILPKAGMVVGLWKSGNKKALNIGSAANPVKVKGSLNSTAVTAANLASMIQGSKNVADSLHVINAVFAE